MIVDNNTGTGLIKEIQVASSIGRIINGSEILILEVYFLSLAIIKSEAKR